MSITMTSLNLVEMCVCVSSLSNYSMSTFVCPHLYGQVMTLCRANILELSEDNLHPLESIMAERIDDEDNEK